MTYTIPVTDRAQSDVAAQNSKAYLNTSDWTRIYDNALYVNGMFFDILYIPITFDTISAPTTATVTTKTMLNTLLANIERMRLYAATHYSAHITDPLFVEIKDDWDEGHTASAPDFTHVNSWEKVLDIMYHAIGDAVFTETNIVDESGNPIIDESGNNLTAEIWV